MKELTVTLNVTEGVPQPSNPERIKAVQAGFRLTLTAASGASAVSEVLQQLVWKFGDLAEGARYGLLIEAVDVNGAVIQSLPALTVTVPTDVPTDFTYTRLDSVSLSWADQAAVL